MNALNRAKLEFPDYELCLSDASDLQESHIERMRRKMMSLGIQKTHNKRVPIKSVRKKFNWKIISKFKPKNHLGYNLKFRTSALDGHQLNNIITIFRDSGQNFFCKFIITRYTFFVGRDTYVCLINSGRFYFFRTVEFLRITFRRIVKMPIEDWSFRLLTIGSSFDFLRASCNFFRKIFKNHAHLSSSKLF